MYRALLFFLLSFNSTFCFPQCVITFPYNEDFELSDGGWQSGGTGSDWTWGQVSKSVITQAASGSNCWVTGGLTSSFYSLGQRSWLQSPCFDFSSLQYPFISFHIFWETEKNYDGGNLQYSLDNGLTWTNLGQYNQAEFCEHNNWYNTSSITNLSGLMNVRDGWSGNSQPTQGSCLGGGGSNGWLPAFHCLIPLAGEPSVTFRFTFGAGTACNDYDGIAIDDVRIGEGVNTLSDFYYTCSGDTFLFTGTPASCTYLLNWNFGDPASGSYNTASGISATHIFSEPGNYLVSHTAASGCSAPVTIAKPVRVLDVSISAEDVSCARGSDGKVRVTVSDTGSFSYTWNTPTAVNDSAFNLTAGTYTVTVSAAGFCDATASAVINEPDVLRLLFTVQNESCKGLNDGSIMASVIGGTSPYSLMWNTQEDSIYITQLAKGVYSVTVHDASGCSTEDSAEVIKDVCPSYIYFPTAFSPDNDGVNDSFKPKYSQDLTFYFIRIYNRWGELVYQSGDVNEGWDGTFEDKVQPLSVYAWYAEYSFSDSSKTAQAGNITLLR